jgi:hypothetical protein
MYRHFAIVTVALTASLAMFAEGEISEVAGAQPVQARPPVAAPPVALQTAAPTSPADDDGWGSGDFDASFGSPMEMLSGGGGSSVIPDLDAIGAPGYSSEYLASLSEEERQLLLQGLQENGMLEPEIRRQRTASLDAASSRRSGSASTEG